jgi:phosphoserine phosphatase RsbU/P
LYSNAGHPPALLYTGESETAAPVKALEADGLAIGMVEGMPYSTSEAQLGPYARLLVYSDGAYEIEKIDGEMWKHSEFVEFVSGLPTDQGPIADPLLAYIHELGASQVLDDDFSIVEARL